VGYGEAEILRVGIRHRAIGSLSLSETQIRQYRWCSPPRRGLTVMRRHSKNGARRSPWALAERLAVSISTPVCPRKPISALMSTRPRHHRKRNPQSRPLGGANAQVRNWRGHCATCSENRSHIDCRSRKNDRRVANGKRFSRIRGGASSARGGALYHPTQETIRDPPNSISRSPQPRTTALPRACRSSISRSPRDRSKPGPEGSNPLKQHRARNSRRPC